MSKGLNGYTNTFSILHSFDVATGAYPTGDLLLSGNTLYGMTNGGDRIDQGVIFSLTLPAVPEPMALPIAIAAALLAGRRRRAVQC